jgi:hypothetical protein
MRLRRRRRPKKSHLRYVHQCLADGCTELVAEPTQGNMPFCADHDWSNWRDNA